MMRYLCLLVMMFIYATAAADTLPFELSITGKNFDVRESLELSGVGEGKTRIGRDFKDKFGKPFRFDLNYKALPENRSYPANLDITVSDGSGEKLGYLFFANNGVQLYAPLADDLPVMAVESGRAQHADPVVCRLEHGGLQFVRPVPDAVAPVRESAVRPVFEGKADRLSPGGAVERTVREKSARGAAPFRDS